MDGPQSSYFDWPRDKSQLYSLELITAPAEEPVTLGEIRSNTRLTQTEDDTELSTIWIPAARRLIEQTLGLRMVTQTWQVNFDIFPWSWGEYPFSFSEIPIGPTQSVTSIKYLDVDGVEQTLSTSVYATDVKRPLARLCLKYGQVWPLTQLGAPNGVRVLFVAGYGARLVVPQNLRAAVMLQAKAMYEGEDGLTDTVKRLVSLEWSGSLDAKT